MKSKIRNILNYIKTLKYAQFNHLLLLLFFSEIFYTFFFFQILLQIFLTIIRTFSSFYEILFEERLIFVSCFFALLSEELSIIWFSFEIISLVDFILPIFNYFFLIMEDNIICIIKHNF